MVDSTVCYVYGIASVITCWLLEFYTVCICMYFQSNAQSVFMNITYGYNYVCNVFSISTVGVLMLTRNLQRH